MALLERQVEQLAALVNVLLTGMKYSYGLSMTGFDAVDQEKVDRSLANAQAIQEEIETLQADMSGGSDRSDSESIPPA